MPATSFEERVERKVPYLGTDRAVRLLYKTYNGRYSLHTPGVIAAPRDVAGPVMPGVRRTPGRPRARDTQGRNDLLPCAGHRV